MTKVRSGRTGRGLYDRQTKMSVPFVTAWKSHQRNLVLSPSFALWRRALRWVQIFHPMGLWGKVAAASGVHHSPDAAVVFRRPAFTSK
jgi:hypothetical protein